MQIERKAVKADSGEWRVERRNDWCLMWTAPPQQKAVSVKGVWSARPAAPR